MDAETIEVESAFACPCCGERNMDRLVWSRDLEHVECITCGAWYDPLED